MSYYCLRGRRGHDRMVVEFIPKNGPMQSVHITTNSKNYCYDQAGDRYNFCKRRVCYDEILRNSLTASTIQLHPFID